MRALCLLLTLIALTGGTPVAKAAELVMFDSDACYWCERWQRDIGGAYARTREGQRAPLRRVDLYAPRPDDLKGIRGVVYTPTFVLVDNGREIGRMVGYQSDHFFWPLLGQMLARLDERQARR